MNHGAVHGSVRWWLRLEGLLIFLLAAYLYALMGLSWWLFAALFFVPDASFAGYLGGPRLGAAVYNAAHSYASALLFAAALLTTGAPVMLAVIWIAHLGFDRALGYGLKYPTSFGDTHLGPIGRRKP
jgi:hypothetical protein